MAKIIRVGNTTITVGKDDGTVVEIPASAFDFTPHQGDSVEVYTSGENYLVYKLEPEKEAQNAAGTPGNGIRCPSCGSYDVEVQTFQEQKGTASLGRTKGSYGKSGHGCLWWIFIGWWWETIMWCCFFPIKLLVEIFKKRGRGKIDAGTASYSHNIIRYKTVCTCKYCGNHWNK